MNRIDVRDISTLTPDDHIDLIEVDLSPIGIEEKYHLCKDCFPNGSLVVFDGVSYTPFPATIEGEGSTSLDNPSRPSLIIETPQAIALTNMLLRDNNDLDGAKVTRITTKVKHLDGQAEPLTTGSISRGIYEIKRVKEQSGLSIAFELESFSFGSALIPKERLTASCSVEYRGAGHCGFSGAPVADINDEPLTEVTATGIEYNDTRQAIGAIDDFIDFEVGMIVVGAGIPINTRITFINVNRSILTLSKQPTVSTGNTLYAALDECGRRNGRNGETGSCKIRHGATINIVIEAGSDIIQAEVGEPAPFRKAIGAFVHTMNPDVGMPIARRIVEILKGDSVGVSSIDLGTINSVVPPSSDTFLNPRDPTEIRRYLITTDAPHGLVSGDIICFENWPIFNNRYVIGADDLSVNANEFYLIAPQVEIKNIQRGATFTTVETWVDHGLETGDQLYFDGTNDSGLNKTTQTITVISDRTFSIANIANPYVTRNRTSYQDSNYLEPLARQAMTGIQAKNDEGVYYISNPTLPAGVSMARLGSSARLNQPIYPTAINGTYPVTIGGEKIYSPDGLPYGGSPGAQLIGGNS